MRPEVFLFPRVVEAHVRSLGLARNEPLEAPLLCWCVRVVLCSPVSAASRRHLHTQCPRLLRVSQVKGVEQQSLLRLEFPRAVPLVAHGSYPLHKVHLCEDRPEGDRIQVGRPRVRGLIVLVLSVAKVHVRGGSVWAAVKQFMQELLVVEPVRGAIRSKKPQVAEVCGNHSISPATGDVAGPPTLVVQVQPGQTPSSLAEELIGLDSVPGAVAKVDDVPGLLALGSRTIHVRCQLLEAFPIFQVVLERWPELPQKGHGGELELRVLLSVEHRPPFLRTSKLHVVRRNMADLDHHPEAIPSTLGQGLVLRRRQEAEARYFGQEGRYLPPWRVCVVEGVRGL
mmetsp:Transcript_43776/g.95285  ORF Transcript_43776/g.95285 Transcript_43776/m.95285 type:complete len:340 (+) Transcript_43776:202-1221(+)